LETVDEIECFDDEDEAVVRILVVKDLDEVVT